MFRFRRLLNASNGIWYYIKRVELATDEYDFSEDGGNAFTIDIYPLNECEDDIPLFDLTLSLSNDGCFARITRDLDKVNSTHEEYSEDLMMPVIHEDMMDCYIENDLLIVATRKS